jgi:hypothetical protein
MHHPVQYQVTAKNIQEDRLRAARASRLAKQSGPPSSSVFTLPFKLFGGLISLITMPVRAFRNEAQGARDERRYNREMAGKPS